MPVAEREWEPSTIRTGLCGDGGVTARCLEMTRDEDDVRPFIMNTGDAVWPYWQEERTIDRSALEPCGDGGVTARCLEMTRKG